MQDRYAGDLGDFGKFGLLKALCADDGDHPALRLAVLWYLVPDEGDAGDGDGKHTRYLEPGKGESFRVCDPDLYERLQRLKDDEDRSVLAIQRREVLPVGTQYHAEPLAYPRGEPRAARQSRRTQWFGDALRAAAGADLVFVDPDNGLEIPSVTSYSRKGPKFAYYDDLTALVEGGASLVVYHHLGRTYGGRRATHAQQISARSAEMRERWANRGSVIALRYRRGTGRAFFIVPAPAHEAVLRRRVTRFVAARWQNHFESVESRIER